MLIREKVLVDLKEAMKNKEADKLSAIRMIQAAMKYREIEVRPQELTEQDSMGVLRKLAKQRKESAEQYRQGGREDLAAKEEFELKVIEAYLPAGLDAAQIEKIVTDAIASTGAKTVKEMGAVIKEVQAKTAGAADNKLVSEIVKKKLQ